MYPDIKTFCSYRIVYFPIVIGPRSITKDTTTLKGNCNNKHQCSNEKAQHKEDSLRSQNMYFAIVSLFVLATFMCIIYIGTKSTVRRRLKANNRDYDMTWKPLYKVWLWIFWYILHFCFSFLAFSLKFIAKTYNYSNFSTTAFIIIIQLLIR